jgi:hypothetical protein
MASAARTASGLLDGPGAGEYPGDRYVKYLQCPLLRPGATRDLPVAPALHRRNTTVMNRRSRTKLLAALLIATALTVDGSTARAQDGTDSFASSLERLSSVVAASPLRVPAVRLDVDEAGRIAKINGFKAEDVDRLWERMNGTPLVGRIRFFAADDGGRSYVEWFRDAGIQHVTIASREDGLFVLVNGSPLPHIAWDSETLVNLLTVLRRFEDDGSDGFSLLGPTQLNTVVDLVPLLRSMDLRLDVRFPVPTDAAGTALVEPLPLPADRAFRTVAAQRQVPMLPRQTVDVEVDYRRLPDGDWVPSFFEFSTLDLAVLAEPFGLEVPEMRMPEKLRQRLVAEGIESIGLQVAEQGLLISVDDRPLPYLSWDESSLANLAALLHQLYPQDGELPEDARWVPVVRATVPMYNDFAISLMFRFPLDRRARVQ